jgi:hypothetical protein
MPSPNLDLAHSIHVADNARPPAGGLEEGKTFDDRLLAVSD